MTYDLVAADTLSVEQTRDLRAIYEVGYAAGERAPWAQISARSRSDNALALVRGDVPAGFALLRGTRDEGQVFLRYLVIDPGERGHGLGAHFWQLITAYASSRGHRQLIWDVPAARTSPGDPAGDDSPPRRIGLFEDPRGSLRPIGEYTTASGGPTWTVPMRLLATALDGEADPIDLRRIALDVQAYRHEIELEAGETHPATTPFDSVAEYDP